MSNKVTEEDIVKDPLNSVMKMISAYQNRTNQIIDVLTEWNDEKVTSTEAMMQIEAIIHDTSFV